MKEYRIPAEPFRVFGIPFYDQTHVMERIPKALREEFPNIGDTGHRCPGARIGFRTDSENIAVKIVFDKLSVDIGMALFACQSANVLIGDRPTARYAALIHPTNYDKPVAEGSCVKSGDMEEVMIYLPRNEVISEIVISLDDDAHVEPPTPYRYALPVLFYGSSITEGGCCTRPTNAYTALVCRWLDADYYNFGFSGAARGETGIADYINTIPMSAFVMDYDHNAPDAEHLRKTHAPFFARIRAAHPTLPILIMSKPDFDYDEHAEERREIIRRTYRDALDAGDKNVYWLDGQSFFGEVERDACTVDRCHPNDLGFYRMAQVVKPVLEAMLRR